MTTEGVDLPHQRPTIGGIYEPAFAPNGRWCLAHEQCGRQEPYMDAVAVRTEGQRGELAVRLLERLVSPLDRVGDRARFVEHRRRVQCAREPGSVREIDHAEYP